LHNHVRLARQTGNHLNLLGISADDRYCRKTILLIRARKIDSKSGANAQR
jgi:hypothetical protein